MSKSCEAFVGSDTGSDTFLGHGHRLNASGLNASVKKGDGKGDQAEMLDRFTKRQFEQHDSSSSRPQICIAPCVRVPAIAVCYAVATVYPSLRVQAEKGECRGIIVSFPTIWKSHPVAGSPGLWETERDGRGFPTNGDNRD